MLKSCVYWIHLPEQTDILTQGYVGVSTKGAVLRYKEHQSKAKNGSNLIIHKVIRKYSDQLIIDTIVKAPIKYCYELEFKLRPTPEIGYNLDAGGNCNRLGAKLSEETKSKQRNIAIAQGRKPSLLAIENSAKTNKLKTCWKCKFADISVWKMADQLYLYYCQNLNHGIRRIATAFKISSASKLSTILKKFRSGWNPLTDEDWLIFSSKLTPDASGDKSISTGISPQIF